MNLRFKGVELTEKAIQDTRKWFADNSIACIEEVKSGKVRVNDPESYFKWRQEEVTQYLNGVHDYTFTFLQRAYYFQTGESVALLSK